MDVRVIFCLSVLVLVGLGLMAEGRPPLQGSLPTLPNGCACDKKTLNCGCCVGIKLDVPHVKINGTGCANLTWLLKEFGLSFTFAWNKKIIFNKTIPATDPPPMCFEFPQVKSLKMCMRLHAVSYSVVHFGACLELGLQIVHIKQVVPLGCIYNDYKDQINTLVPRDTLTSRDILQWLVENKWQHVLSLIGGIGDILDGSQKEKIRANQEVRFSKFENRQKTKEYK